MNHDHETFLKQEREATARAIQAQINHKHNEITRLTREIQLLHGARRILEEDK